MTTKGKNVYVSPRKDGTTAVKKEGNKRATSIHDTKTDAIKEGREIAKRQQGELIIKDKTGKITDKDSYGNDPCPPKDKKN